MEKGLRRYIGDRAFYKLALGVMLPLILQSLITSFVSLLDNIMVGQCGTAPMSGVAVVGQLMFNYVVIIFGTVAGPGIFCAQYFGAGDEGSLRAAFRCKLVLSLIVAVVCMGVLHFWGMPLAGLFLNGEEAARAEVMAYAMDYARVIIWMMLPFAISSAYSTTLRETGQTVVPMLASIAAVFVNLFLNWVLIFGKLGAPELGVVGAAWATVASRVVEAAINVVYSHVHAGRLLFAKGLFGALPVHKGLFGRILRRSLPLFFNEFLWSTGTSVLMQVYCTRGLEVVAALNIAYVIQDLFQMAAFSTGNTIGIIVGQQLGAGELDRAVDTDRKLIAFGLVVALVLAALMCLIAPLFPRLYNTTEEVRTMACRIVLVMAAILPFGTLSHSGYFTLRSGGKTALTFIFDCGFMWLVNIPVAWCAAHLTALHILLVYLISNGTELIKSAIGLVLVRKRIWVNNLTEKENANAG